MARITRKELEELCMHAVGGTGWQLWLQHSATGWTVQRGVEGTSGAEPLGECLTAGECKQLLRGLAIAGLFK